MKAGILGAIIGVLIGIAGGIIGTYFSIKNTSGPKEKAFMVRAAVVMWIAAAAFILFLLCLPKPYNYLVWVLYGIALPIGIIYVNKKQRQIQEEEKGIKVQAPTSRILLDKVKFCRIFSPGVSGIYLTERLSGRFLDGLARRIESGLFPKAPKSRNRYVISSRTEDQLKFTSLGWATSAYVGLNDVSVKVDSEQRVLWNVKYRKWAMYGVRICLIVGIILILARFLLFPESLYGLWGEILFWFLVIFWGLLWPWILAAMHKRPVSGLLRYIFDEVNQAQME